MGEEMRALSYIENFTSEINSLGIDDKIQLINEARQLIHEASPFKNEPVDFVSWVKIDQVIANDYNPNKVAPPEMELLEVSIMNDGYTQPIVTWNNEEKQKNEVVDGFHRNRVGKESKIINKRIMGYLPIVDIRSEQSGKSDRIASTIRHNRARGKHQVDAMSEIVLELKNRNWTNARVAKQLGMDEEEVLRLCQISGLEEIFSDSDFNRAWESTDSEGVFDPITDDIDHVDMERYKIPNEGDRSRIFHTYDKWECHKAGFYKSVKPGLSKEDGEKMYAEFLSNDDKFKAALGGVITEWKHSCEHYLTNKSMNRIAWLGQASMCYAECVPSSYCSGFNLLSSEEQERANDIAFEYLTKWLEDNDRMEVDMDEALNIGRQMELY